ncbi:MAG: hypothetical protein KME25_11545 [Symplocastrum torsivum CPER-KK1]|uniref:Uncharacterized protein n=1 Tax=Symplocastrum torsivum CPER-KK1 TaxID=450513 RepID=A0A951PLC8_9CYAN|nr:hypothetical protein [Symplocastrum torsivum CPER-KK1]
MRVTATCPITFSSKIPSTAEFAIAYSINVATNNTGTCARGDHKNAVVVEAFSCASWWLSPTGIIF